MKLANNILRVLAVGAILPCAISGAWAQKLQQPLPANAKNVGAGAQKKPAQTGTTPPSAGKAGGTPAAQAAPNKRDPFAPLINDKKDAGSPEHLPPGKAGLVVATVEVVGTIKSPTGMMAVVSNPEQHVYFIKEGDQLYDGNVEKISIDGVTFKENSKDAFGKPVEREVTKRLYSSAGEQQ